MLPVQKPVAVMPFRSTVPLKYRNNCPTARHLYDHIMRSENFSHIKKAMIAERICKAEKRADELIKAWVQWFCAGATTITKSHVMMVGPVDRTFHQIVLHTKWYFSFCYYLTGVYTHHDPLDEEQLAHIQDTNAILETINRIERAFGNDLSPDLKSWRRQYSQGKLVPSMVSCTGNEGPFDILPRNV